MPWRCCMHTVVKAVTERILVAVSRARGYQQLKDNFAGEPTGRAARLPNNEMGGRKEVVPKPGQDV